MSACVHAHTHAQLAMLQNIWNTCFSCRKVGGGHHILSHSIRTSLVHCFHTLKLPHNPQYTQVFEDGVDLYECGRLQEAQAKFQEVLKQSPEDRCAEHYMTLIAGDDMEVSKM